MAVEGFTNQPAAIVTSGGNDAPAPGTTEVWTASAGWATFPPAVTGSSQYHICDEDSSTETILVTNVSGTSASVVRGADGTTPVVHSAPFPVAQVLAAGWLSSVTTGLPPSGDTTGATDPGNIQALLNLTGKAPLQVGTFYMGGSSAVSLATAGTEVAGSGNGTKLQIVAGFSAAEVFAVTANSCTIRDLAIVGASSTITSNPACNGIEVTGAQFCRVVNVFFQYINGWCIESVGGSSVANIGCRFDNPTGYNCAGGIHVKGVTGSSFGGQQWITNPHFSQIGAASGGSANLDGIMIEDVSDVYISSYDGAISDVGTGSTLHIKGLCSSIFVDDFDLGCFPNGSPNNSVLKIEDSSNGSPGGLHFNAGILQSALVGATVSGAASRIYFHGVDFANNATHGCVLSGSGSQVYFSGDCTFRGNGSGASGTNYDLNISGTTTGYVRGCHFLSPVTTTGVSGVQSVVAITGGQNMPFEDTDFSGSGSTLSTIFTNLPTWVRNCRNYNPHGSVTVSVPASGSPTGALHYDAMYYITAADVSYAFTATSASPCVFTATGSAYANGTLVTLTGTSLPAGFTQGTGYYVVSASGTTFELSATSGGSAINSTSTGSGTVAAACSLVRNTNGFGGGTGPAIVIPAGACVPVMIRAGGNFTPTFITAPTWLVDGL